MDSSTYEAVLATARLIYDSMLARADGPLSVRVREFDTKVKSHLSNSYLHFENIREAALAGGTGVVLAAALTSGAAKAHGFELPENQANQYIFQAAMRRISSKLYHIPDISRRVMLDFNDIVKVFLNYFSEFDQSFSEIKAEFIF